MRGEVKKHLRDPHSHPSREMAWCKRKEALFAGSPEEVNCIYCLKRKKEEEEDK